MYHEMFRFQSLLVGTTYIHTHAHTHARPRILAL